jgi:predicted nucleic acid-binding protein
LRANSGTAKKSWDYLDTVFAAIPVESFSKEMAQIAAKVAADARKRGMVEFPRQLRAKYTAAHHAEQEPLLGGGRDRTRTCDLLRVKQAL